MSGIPKESVSARRWLVHYPVRLADATTAAARRVLVVARPHPPRPDRLFAVLVGDGVNGLALGGVLAEHPTVHRTDVPHHRPRFRVYTRVVLNWPSQSDLSIGYSRTPSSIR